ncbi:hypothetical protein BT93_E2392 [Corymbia citriodora subsp. variegata]|nr:hypothetical protein BT93_E2392 [Corymbia citriodora subsp. variegata]
MAMANRRCLQALTRRATSLFSSTSAVRRLETPPPLSAPSPPKSLFEARRVSPGLEPSRCPPWPPRARLFCSSKTSEDEEEEDEDGEGGEFMEESDCETGKSSTRSKWDYTPEEREAEAAAIGYTVLGPLERSERVFKLYEPFFAVVQIGSHQFKVSNGDCIFTERLKFCDINDKLILNKVLLLGSQSQTIVGRPTVPDAAVHAVVEEHALDAKVIIFKKKRRKNYRRTKGHRQELTKLRITDIQGIEKPEKTDNEKPVKSAVKKLEKVAVAA